MEEKLTIILNSNEGKKIKIGGVEIFLKSHKDTNSSWALYEYTAPPLFGGPPAHYHKIMEEAFYVLEGTLTFAINKEIITMGKGGYVHIPVGIVHTFSNKTNLPAKILILVSPPGFENYFLELEELIRIEGSYPPKDVNKLFALLDKYDTHLHT